MGYNLNMKYFTIIITLFSLGCTTTSKHAIKVGKLYNIDECLKHECDLGCGEEPDDTSLPLVETINCNGNTIVVVDKTDFGDQWIVITTDGLTESCPK